MNWQGYFTAVFRGNTTDDPTAEGYVEKEIGVYGLDPEQVYDDEAKRYWGGVIAPPVDSRWQISVVCLPFATRTGIASGNMTHADYLQLRAVFNQPYTWLYRAHYAGGTGVLPRAAAGGTDTFWNQTTDDPAGILPLAVVCPDGMEKEPDFENGVERLAFTLYSRDRI